MENDDRSDPCETDPQDGQWLARISGWWSEVYRRRAILIRIGFVLGMVLILVRVIVPPSLWAQGQGPNRAGLVILHGDGRMTTACVRFQEQSISGIDLLDRSGVGYIVQYNSMGAAVCKIEDEGCDYPAADCFCHCKGASCAYWNYYHLQDGRWNYASLGASASRIAPGEVDGWVWGSRSTQPPQLTLDQICTVDSTGPATAAPLLVVPPTIRNGPSSATAGAEDTNGSTAPRPPTSLSTQAPTVAATEPLSIAPQATIAPPKTSNRIPQLPAQSQATATPLNSIPTSASRDTAQGTDQTTTVGEQLATPESSGPLATEEPAGGVVATATAPQGQTAIPANYLLFGVLVLVLVGGIVGVIVRKN